MGNCYVHLSYLHREAVVKMADWIESHGTEIFRINKSRGCVTCNNGDLHYFMSEYSYIRWCKGRTYILNGEWYRSDRKIERNKE